MIELERRLSTRNIKLRIPQPLTPDDGLTLAQCWLDVRHAGPLLAQ